MVDTNQTQTDKKEMSKKSEKLEIRLSYEEKQELSSVAEIEGRTVSDLVRGLIRRYVKVSRERLPRRRSYGWMIGLGLFCFLLGHMATLLVAHLHNLKPH
ncbi:MAG: hypothetical protein ABJ275_07015 [Maricaulaceae bacterium]